MPAGRPSLYTDAIVQEICDRLSEGESLITICKDSHTPGIQTVLDWASANADFRAKYARAREAQAEFMDHKIMTAADEATSENAAANRVKIDAYKWRAAKLAPKRYGDRTIHSGDADNPLELRTINRNIVDPSAL